MLKEGNYYIRAKCDTYVINGAEGETGVGEAGKAISIKPGLQRCVLKHTDSVVDSWCRGVFKTGSFGL